MNFVSYDDLLNPKLKGKIGFLDPQYPGAGQGSWTFLWASKGEEFLKKLVQQELFVTANARQMAEALAKGKIAICIGCSRHNVTPFIKAGLPVKLLPIAKEGDEVDRRLRGWHSEKRATSQCREGFRQLALEQGRTGSCGVKRCTTARGGSMSTPNGWRSMTSSRQKTI